MEPDFLFSLLPALLGITGSLLGVIAKLRTKKEFGASPKSKISSGAKVLLAFGFVVVTFAAVALYRYWSQIITSADEFMFAGGLFLTMIAGMFVQVLSGNYRAGRPLLDISATQLIFPLLFAVVVFYPIWTLAANAQKNLFPFYAAFLNGYFWESVVSAAKNPSPNSVAESPTNGVRASETIG